MEGLYHFRRMVRPNRIGDQIFLRTESVPNSPAQRPIQSLPTESIKTIITTRIIRVIRITRGESNFTRRQPLTRSMHEARNSLVAKSDQSVQLHKLIASTHTEVCIHGHHPRREPRIIYSPGGLQDESFPTRK
jgi:hypothetical protein